MCTFFVYRDFGIRMLFGFAGLGILLMMNILHRFLEKKPPVMTNYKIMAGTLCAVISLFFLMPYSNKDADNFSLIYSMLVCIALVLFSDSQEAGLVTSIRVMAVAGICLSVFVLFFTAFEDLFWVTVGPLLSDTAQEYLRHYVPRGYGVTLGGCTYTDYILVFGMVAISAWLFFEKCTPRQKLIGWTLIVVSGVAVICVGRKGEVVALFATIFVLLLVHGTPEQRKKRAGVLAAAVGIGVAAFLLLLPVLRRVDVLARYIHMVDNLLAGKDITSGRLELYALAWELFMEHPIFGIGWGQFANEIPFLFYLEHSSGGIQVLRDVHCIYLQFLCESGIVGFLCIMTPLGYCYIHTLKQMLRLQNSRAISERGTVCRMLNYISFCIQTFVFGVGLIDPSFQRVQFWCFYGAALMMQNTALCIENAPTGGRFERTIQAVTDGIQKILNRLFAGKADW